MWTAQYNCTMQLQFQKFLQKKNIIYIYVRLLLLLVLGRLEKIDTNSNVLAKFLQICMNTHDLMTPRKKCVSGNNMSFINKELSSAHKKRTQLRNRYLRKRSYQKKRLYTKQRIFCVSLLRKTKKKHYANLNHKDIADNK